MFENNPSILMMIALYVQSHGITESDFCLFVSLGNTLSTEVKNK